LRFDGDGSARVPQLSPTGVKQIIFENVDHLPTSRPAVLSLASQESSESEAKINDF
jgi:hypothetical protein